MRDGEVSEKSCLSNSLDFARFVVDGVLLRLDSLDFLRFAEKSRCTNSICIAARKEIEFSGLDLALQN